MLEETNMENKILLEGKIFKVRFSSKKKDGKPAMYSFRMQSFDQRDKNPIYIDCKAWDDLAEQVIDRNIGEGDTVKVLGELKTTKNENREFYFIKINTMQEIEIKEKQEKKSRLLASNDTIPF